MVKCEKVGNSEGGYLADRDRGELFIGWLKLQDNRGVDLAKPRCF